MSFSKVYDDFCKTAESLLVLMQIEEQHLKDTHLAQLDSLLQKKAELFESNQHCANQLLDPTYWEQLEKSQRQNISQLLKSVTDTIQQNLKLLDISKRGNKKLMEIYFNKMKSKPAFYTASGKLFENSYAPSLGVQQMV
jgi:hypothetical protein